MTLGCDAAGLDEDGNRVLVHGVVADPGAAPAADETLDLIVPGSKGALLNWLHETCDVIAREARKDGSIEVRIRVPSEKKARVIGQLRKSGVSV